MDLTEDSQRALQALNDSSNSTLELCKGVGERSSEQKCAVVGNKCVLFSLKVFAKLHQFSAFISTDKMPLQAKISLEMLKANSDKWNFRTLQVEFIE